MSTFLFIYHTKIDKVITSLSKQTGYINGNGLLGFFLLVLVALCGIYPYLSLSFVIIIGLLVFDKKQKRGEGLNG
ncbi:hypothetical protein CFK37_03260 [Virgibacillus phasianinus]|uniref:Uncharacterized protein n=1 Tax=Virgibacillus phasianinus TaxID=2017483 RepID=A0A220U017_9BACI|nr:hypothetical protein [Virgibacillus phasianinus]ASK61266.1 hypothetical protein CFK37_03260 [Virgibacillus phasianinus]